MSRTRRYLIYALTVGIPFVGMTLSDRTQAPTPEMHRALVAR